MFDFQILYPVIKPQNWQFWDDNQSCSFHRSGWPEILTPTVIKCGYIKYTLFVTQIRSINVLRLNFIALNDRYWINWHSWGEKMSETITLWKLLCHQKFLPQQSWGQLGLPSTTVCMVRNQINVSTLIPCTENELSQVA